MSDLNPTATFGFYPSMFCSTFFSTGETKNPHSSSFSARSEADRNFILIVILRLLKEATKILRIGSFTHQPPHVSTLKNVLFRKNKST